MPLGTHFRLSLCSFFNILPKISRKYSAAKRKRNAKKNLLWFSKLTIRPKTRHASSRWHKAHPSFISLGWPPTLSFSCTISPLWPPREQGEVIESPPVKLLLTYDFPLRSIPLFPLSLFPYPLSAVRLRLKRNLRVHSSSFSFSRNISLRLIFDLSGIQYSFLLTVQLLFHFEH